MKKTCNTCKYFYTKGGYTGKCEADDYNEFMTTQEACDIYEDKDNEEEYRFPTDEEFEKELFVSNYIMRKMAISLGLSEKEAESPSKCCYTIGQEQMKYLIAGMNGEEKKYKINEKEIDRVAFGIKEFEKYKRNNYKFDLPDNIEAEIQKCIEKFTNDKNENIHVYCTNCKNYPDNLECAQNDGDNNCDCCKCDGCNCEEEDDEDSMIFIERPNYIEEIINDN